MVARVLFNFLFAIFACCIAFNWVGGYLIWKYLISKISMEEASYTWAELFGAFLCKVLNEKDLMVCETWLEMFDALCKCYQPQMNHKYFISIQLDIFEGHAPKCKPKINLNKFPALRLGNLLDVLSVKRLTLSMLMRPKHARP